MKCIPLNLLVLDDQPKQAFQALKSAFMSYIPASADPVLSPWQLKLSDDIQIDVHVDFALMETLSSIKVAKQFLLARENLVKYDVIFVDKDWGEGGGDDNSGLDLLESMAAAKVFHPFLALLTRTDINPTNIVRALKGHAAAFVQKTEPIHILNVILSAAWYMRLRGLETALVKNLEAIDPRLRSDSPTMQRCLADACIYAGNARLPILLSGPTGSGKELLARAIHKSSPRAARPFEFVDCATLTNSDLAKSELFGHERGAFTGAENSRQGIFEIANGGTVFLDEVHALPQEIHAMLHRIIETGEYRRMGGNSVLKADVRLISATSKNFEELVRSGRFERDFYERIKGCEIRLPGLNQRLEDLQWLAEMFLRDFCKTSGHAPIALDTTTIPRLMAHNWTANIRELRWTMERSATRLGDKVALQPDDLVFEGAAFDPPSKPLDSVLLSRLVRARPREGNQSAIFDVLVERYPFFASYSELLHAIGQDDATPDRASQLLATKVSQLRKRLYDFRFSVENEDRQGYRLSVAHNI